METENLDNKSMKLQEILDFIIKSEYKSEYIQATAIIVRNAFRNQPDNITLVNDTKNEKRYHCNTCGVEHSIYRIYFSSMHLQILRKVYAYCVENNTHTIEKSKIPGLTHTDYGNFYVLRRFGLLYWIKSEDGKKVKGGNWGVCVGRIHAFLTGNGAIAEYSEKNTASEHMENSKTRISINQIPRYKTLIDDQNAFMPYFVKYEQNPIFENPNIS